MESLTRFRDMNKSFIDVDGGTKNFVPYPLNSDCSSAILVLLLIYLCSEILSRFITRLFRKPFRSLLGIDFEYVEIKPQSMSIIVYDLQVDMSRSIYKGFVFLFFPSAATPLRHTQGSSHDGVVLTLESISLTFSLKFRYYSIPLLLFDEGLKESSSARNHWLPVLTPAVSIQVSRFDLRLDKAYIAPQPPLDFLSSSSSDTKHLPLALQYLFLDTDCFCECQTFDQDYFLNYLEENETSQANRIVTLLKLWLKGLKHSTERKASFSNVAKKILKLALYFLFPCIEFRAVGCLITVTGLSGADSSALCNCRDWMGKGKNLFYLASSSIRGRGAVTKISCERFMLSFCGKGMLSFVMNNYLIQICDKCKQEEIDLFSCSSSSFQWSGCIEYICWCFLYYDNLWNKRHFHGTLNVEKITLNLVPRSVHTFLTHFDDFTNTNSPFNEWHRWLSKRKNDLELEESERTSKKQLLGRALYREVTRLQKTLWDHSCQELEFVSFLNSTCSRVDSIETGLEPTDLDYDIRQWARNAFDSSSLFDSVYPSIQVAQLFFLWKKFDTLSPRFTISVDVSQFCISSLPQNSVVLVEDICLELDITNVVFPTDSNKTSNPDKNRNRRASMIRLCWLRAELCAGLPSRVLFTASTSLKNSCHDGAREISRSYMFEATFEFYIMPCRQQTPHLKAELRLQGLTIGVTPLLLPVIEIVLETARVPFVQAKKYIPVSNESMDIFMEMNETSMLFLDDLNDMSMGSLCLKIDNLTCTSSVRSHMNTLEVSTNQIDLSMCNLHDYELIFDYLPFKTCFGIDEINACFKFDILDQIVHAFMTMGSIDLNLSPTFNFLIVKHMETIRLSILEWSNDEETASPHIDLKGEDLSKNSNSHNKMDDTTESHILSELSDILQEQKTSTNSTLNTSEAWRLKMYINRIRKISELNNKLTSDNLDHSLQESSECCKYLNQFGDGFDVYSLDRCIDQKKRLSPLLFWLRNNRMVQYDDLHEYASSEQVYKITGFLYEKLPQPSEWLDKFWMSLDKEGIDLSENLESQDVSEIQRRFVRSLGHYEFAKFAWQEVVRPELRDRKEGLPVPDWLLDDNANCSPFRSRMTDSCFKQLDGGLLGILSFKSHPINISFRLDLFSFKVTIGNAFKFSNPIMDWRMNDMCLDFGSCRERSCSEDILRDSVSFKEMKCSNLSSALDLYFESTIHAEYLNSSHDEMEVLCDSYKVIGSSSIKVATRGSQHDDAISIKLICSRNLNITLSPSVVEKFIVIQRFLSPNLPDLIESREIEFLHNLWEAKNINLSSSFSRDTTKEIIDIFVRCHVMPQECSPVRINDEVQKYLASIFDDDFEQISFDTLVQKLIKDDRKRCRICTGEMRVLNETGQKIQLDVDDKPRKLKSTNGTTSHNDDLIEPFHIVDNGMSITFGNLKNTGTLHISISLGEFKMLSSVPISSYQSIAVPLPKAKFTHGRRTKRKYKPVSGFPSSLAIEPFLNNIDAITMKVRSILTIDTKVNVDVRIVRLSDITGYELEGNYGSKGSKLRGKALEAKLKQAVENAPVEYEHTGVLAGSCLSVPFNIVVSSSYHALLIKNPDGNWRLPVLLTTTFLFNDNKHIEIQRCHSISGICVGRKWMNILTRKKSAFGSFHKSHHHSAPRRVCDTVIQIFPSLAISNAMPFKIYVRCWQAPIDDGEDEWKLYLQQSENIDVDGIKSNRHYSSFLSRDFSHQDSLEKGKVVLLNGVNLEECVYVQVARESESKSHIPQWMTPMRIDFNRVRKKSNDGRFYAFIDGQDVSTFFLGVLFEKQNTPEITIFCPYWIINKTGSSIEIKFGNSSSDTIRDSGLGGLPILGGIDEIAVQVRNIHMDNPFWDHQNGNLVPSGDTNMINSNLPSHWSNRIRLDAAGTSFELNCGSHMLGASIKTLTGVFHRSNLVTILPRYILKNGCTIAIEFIPVLGSLQDVKILCKRLNVQQEYFNVVEDMLLIVTKLNFRDSTIIQLFSALSLVSLTGLKQRFILVRFLDDQASVDCNWRIVPVDSSGLTYFPVQCGVAGEIIGAMHVRSEMREATTFIGIEYNSQFPYRIENRSLTHYIHFSQNDRDCLVLELPPMTSTSYTYENPFGKKEVRAVAIAKESSRECRGADDEHCSRCSRSGSDRQSGSYDTACSSIDPTQPTISHVDTSGAMMEQSSRLNKDTIEQISVSEEGPSYQFLDRKRIFSSLARKFNLLKIGEGKSLPCPYPNGYISPIFNGCRPHLYTNIRIEGGIRVLSFTDSEWFLKSMKVGLEKRHLNFKNTHVDVWIEGGSFTLANDVPLEIACLNFREFSIRKQSGHLETVILLRYLQLDAMLDNSRYPVVFHPFSRTLENRGTTETDAFTSSCLHDYQTSPQQRYWVKEGYTKRCPFFETTLSLLPQENMLWVPTLKIDLTPMKVDIDLSFMFDIVHLLKTAPKEFLEEVQQDTVEALLAAIEKNISFPASSSGLFPLTYIEHLDINPVQIDMNLDMKPDIIYNSRKSDEIDQMMFYNEGSILDFRLMNSLLQNPFFAGVTTWLMNAAAVFTHVSPSFHFKKMIKHDYYGDTNFLFHNVYQSYLTQTILQAYKVLLSVQAIGDPSALIRRYRIGIIDLFKISGREIAAGGKEGLGKGVKSFFTNVSGGTFSAAESIVISLSKIIGLEPILVKHLRRRKEQPRCRPPRIVEWGGEFGFMELPFLNTFGIRLHYLVHEEKYFKISFDKYDEQVQGPISGQRVSNEQKQFRKAKASADKARNPMRKIIGVRHNKEEHFSLSGAIKPKVIKMGGSNESDSGTIHYMTVFEETIVLKLRDLRLSDDFIISVWDHNILLGRQGRPLACCSLTIRDIHKYLANYCKHERIEREKYLRIKVRGHHSFKADENNRDCETSSLSYPPIEEYAMFRPSPKRQRIRPKDTVASSIVEELKAISLLKDECLDFSDSDTNTDTISIDESIDGDGQEKPTSMEYLYGHLAVSFFPVDW